MPKPRLPTNVLAMRGAFKKNPARGAERENEPQPAEFDVAALPVPVSLTELEAIVWRDIVGTMHEGVVCAADVPALIVTVRLATRALYDETIDPKVTAQLRGYIAQFGMSPADRSRVSVARRPAHDPSLDEFFK